jgi:hypothetical protein
MVFDQEYKNTLINDFFNEGWKTVNYYQFMKSLTEEEIIVLTVYIGNMGYFAYFYGNDYVFNPILLSFISLFIKKLKIREHNYYIAVRYWLEFDEIPNKPKDFLTQLLLATEPNDFSYRSEKIFI